MKGKYCFVGTEDKVDSGEVRRKGHKIEDEGRGFMFLGSINMVCILFSSILFSRSPFQSLNVLLLPLS
jgi:hypothetical protein